MRIAAGRREDDFEINVISLIDVLLTLLMFFVLTTTFVQHSRMQVTLPQADTHDSDVAREAFVILIDPAAISIEFGHGSKRNKIAPLRRAAHLPLD